LERPEWIDVGEYKTLKLSPDLAEYKKVERILNAAKSLDDTKFEISSIELIWNRVRILATPQPPLCPPSLCPLLHPSTVPALQPSSPTALQPSIPLSFLCLFLLQYLTLSFRIYRGCLRAIPGS
jgi:hypothetical protein